MLFELEVENFYSIRDRQTVDLRVAANVPDIPGKFGAVWPGAKERVPKVIAIFGANASGKSTILRALSFIAWFVRESFNLPPNSRLPYERFNDSESLSNPTKISISLSGFSKPDSEDSEPCRYTYALEVGGESDKPQHVISEQLFYWPPPYRRKIRLFHRNSRGKTVASDAFKLSGYRKALENILRPNVSVISTLAQLKHPFATYIWSAASLVASNILMERSDGVEAQSVRLYAENPTLVDALNREIERIDLGIRSMSIESGPAGPIALFVHEGHDGPMPLVLESHGTRTFLRLFPFLLRALETGGIAILDELDTAIHPLVLPEILSWFYDQRKNPLDAQLWMTCHNASLMDSLVKEEVVFCSKSSLGRSEIFLLKDFQSVRRDENLLRKYLGGSYGAVPRFG